MNFLKILVIIKPLNKMDIKNIFDYGTWIIPFIIIFLTGYKRNEKLFIIGILTSIFISYSFYANSLLLEVCINNCDLPIDATIIEKNRHLVIIDIGLIGGIIIIVYNILIGFLIWNILIKKSKKASIRLKNFLKQSSFYFILSIGMFIDIFLYKFNDYIYWHFMLFSFFLIIPLFIKAIYLKYKPINNNRKTSKLTWFVLFLIIAFYIFTFNS